MDELDKDLTLQWYEWLEEQLLDIMKVIPPAEENFIAYSPRPASLIVDACGLLDSILRQVSPNPAIVDGRSKARDELNIVDYAKLYASKFELPDLFSILLVSPPRYLNPFENWAGLVSGGQYQSLLWWSTHTDLKHDWIGNLKKGCLKTAIESLCALHQIISVVPDLAESVLRRGWVPGNKPNPQIVIEILQGKSHQSWPLLIESSLFAVPRGKEKLPTKIEDFKPAFFNASEKITDFFGRW